MSVSSKKLSHYEVTFLVAQNRLAQMLHIDEPSNQTWVQVFNERFQESHDAQCL